MSPGSNEGHRQEMSRGVGGCPLFSCERVGRAVKEQVRWAEAGRHTHRNIPGGDDGVSD